MRAFSARSERKRGVSDGLANSLKNASRANITRRIMCLIHEQD
jgi:hypothetical protein